MLEHVGDDRVYLLRQGPRTVGNGTVGSYRCHMVWLERDDALRVTRLLPPQLRTGVTVAEVPIADLADYLRRHARPMPTHMVVNHLAAHPYNGLVALDDFTRIVRDAVAECVAVGAAQNQA